MTPEERDALIDATVEQCAKVAENYRNRAVIIELDPLRMIERVGGDIAAAIRAEFKK